MCAQSEPQNSYSKFYDKIACLINFFNVFKFVETHGSTIRDPRSRILCILISNPKIQDFKANSRSKVLKDNPSSKVKKLFSNK